jgi:hypothetical protein
MSVGRTGLLTIRVWLEPGSAKPLRANLRFTGDVSRGYEHALLVSDADALKSAVMGWLNEFAGEASDSAEQGVVAAE